MNLFNELLDRDFLEDFLEDFTLLLKSYIDNDEISSDVELGYSISHKVGYGVYMFDFLILVNNRDSSLFVVNDRGVMVYSNYLDLETIKEISVKIKRNRNLKILLDE